MHEIHWDLLATHSLHLNNRTNFLTEALPFFHKSFSFRLGGSYLIFPRGGRTTDHHCERGLGWSGSEWIIAPAVFLGCWWFEWQWVRVISPNCMICTFFFNSTCLFTKLDNSFNFNHILFLNCLSCFLLPEGIRALLLSCKNINKIICSVMSISVFHGARGISLSHSQCILHSICKKIFAFTCQFPIALMSP